MAEKDVNVKVVLDTPGSVPPFHFESSDLPITNKPGKENFIYFSNCGKYKGFNIHYELDDTANPGYRFPTKQSHPNSYLDDALWASQSGSCPTGPSNWKEVFKAKDVENGGRNLIVFNKNAVVEDFFYTLRVWNGTDWLELDPGAGNQNGGEPFTFESVAACAITGGIVGLGASLLANNLLEPSGALVFGLAGAVVGLIVGFVASRF